MTYVVQVDSIGEEGYSVLCELGKKGLICIYIQCLCPFIGDESLRVIKLVHMTTKKHVNRM